MSSRFVASLTLFSFLSVTSLPALAVGPRAGNLESQSGQVLVQQGDQWQPLQGAELPVGATLRTGADGQAILRVGDSRVRVAPNSQLRLVASDQAAPRVALERGRLLTRAEAPLVISTQRSTTSATKGEFVLETNAQGSALRVLSGNARQQAVKGETVSFGGLASLPAEQAAPLATLADLGQTSAVGEIALTGEWKTKGKGVRVRQSDEAVGGQDDAAPDQDVPRPRQPEPPVVDNTPPTPPTQPTTPPQPPTQPTTPVVTKTGFGAGWVIGGLALLGGIIAIATGGDDDDDNVFVPGNPGVPSPALP